MIHDNMYNNKTSLMAVSCEVLYLHRLMIMIRVSGMAISIRLPPLSLSQPVVEEYLNTLSRSALVFCADQAEAVLYYSNVGAIL